jgi:hypothetical protein
MRVYLYAISLIVLMRSSVSKYSGEAALHRLIPPDAASCVGDAMLRWRRRTWNRVK